MDKVHQVICCKRSGCGGCFRSYCCTIQDTCWFVCSVTCQERRAFGFCKLLCKFDVHFSFKIKHAIFQQRARDINQSIHLMSWDGIQRSCVTSSLCASTSFSSPCGSKCCCFAWNFNFFIGCLTNTRDRANWGNLSDNLD